MRNTTCAVLLAVFTFVPTAWAHKPIEDDGTHTNAAAAIAVSDVSVSQVAYHEVTAESPSVWFAFTVPANEPLYVQLGVPNLARLTNYRPAIAVLGPGLPAVDVPFAVPEGYGGWVFLSDDTAPTEFHEPFTGTNSWILLEENLVLPTAGKYYVVAFDPAGSPGKLWVAVGESEAFGLSDIISLPATIKEVRKFHEISTGGFGFWIRRLFEWIKAIISFM